MNVKSVMQILPITLAKELGSCIGIREQNAVCTSRCSSVCGHITVRDNRQPVAVVSHMRLLKDIWYNLTNKYISAIANQQMIRIKYAAHAMLANERCNLGIAYCKCHDEYVCNTFYCCFDALQHALNIPIVVVCKYTARSRLSADMVIAEEMWCSKTCLCYGTTDFKRKAVLYTADGIKTFTRVDFLTLCMYIGESSMK